jgi:hypothetical protein
VAGTRQLLLIFDLSQAPGESKAKDEVVTPETSGFRGDVVCRQSRVQLRLVHASALRPAAMIA